MSKNILIKNIKKTKNSLKISWNDGKRSDFNFMWLRDNCSQNMHKDARQRIFNFLAVSEKIYPKKYSIKNNGVLEIIWSEGDHISVFKNKWLRENCYTIKNNKKYKSPFILWDKEISLKKITVDYNLVIKSNKELIKWLELLHHYGVAIVKNAPKKNKSAMKILNRISHIRETFFGSPFEVINIPKPNNAAYTSEALRNHTDLPFYEYSPGYQFLHCLINDAKGGLSSVVDAFSVANYIKNKDFKTFKILTTIPVKYQNNDYTQNTIRIFHSPMISLNNFGDYKDVRFSIATMGVMDCHPKKMQKFYSAYRKFAKLLHSKKFQLNFRLEAGDIFSFDNRRILHGRTEFDSNSGHRHLQGYYMDRDEILGRLNFLKGLKL